MQRLEEANSLWLSGSRAEALAQYQSAFVEAGPAAAAPLAAALVHSRRFPEALSALRLCPRAGPGAEHTSALAGAFAELILAALSGSDDDGDDAAAAADETHQGDGPSPRASTSNAGGNNSPDLLFPSPTALGPRSVPAASTAEDEPIDDPPALLSALRAQLDAPQRSLAAAAGLALTAAACAESSSSIPTTSSEPPRDSALSVLSGLRHATDILVGAGRWLPAASLAAHARAAAAESGRSDVAEACGALAEDILTSAVRLT